MIHLSHLIWSALVLGIGSGLFLVAYDVDAKEKELARLTADIRRTTESIHVLRAEWSFLNNPDRLERLADSHLTLKPVRPDQYVSLTTLAALPPRPEAPPDAVTTPGLPMTDPLEDDARPLEGAPIAGLPAGATGQPGATPVALGQPTTAAPPPVPRIKPHPGASASHPRTSPPAPATRSASAPAPAPAPAPARVAAPATVSVAAPIPAGRETTPTPVPTPLPAPLPVSVPVASRPDPAHAGGFLRLGDQR